MDNGHEHRARAAPAWCDTYRAGGGEHGPDANRLTLEGDANAQSFAEGLPDADEYNLDATCDPAQTEWGNGPLNRRVKPWSLSTSPRLLVTTSHLPGPQGVRPSVSSPLYLTADGVAHLPAVSLLPPARRLRRQVEQQLSRRCPAPSLACASEALTRPFLGSSSGPSAFSAPPISSNREADSSYSASPPPDSPVSVQDMAPTETVNAFLLQRARRTQAGRSHRNASTASGRPQQCLQQALLQQQPLRRRAGLEEPSTGLAASADILGVVEQLRQLLSRLESYAHFLEGRPIVSSYDITEDDGGLLLLPQCMTAPASALSVSASSVNPYPVAGSATRQARRQRQQYQRQDLHDLRQLIFKVADLTISDATSWAAANGTPTDRDERNDSPTPRPVTGNTAPSGGTGASTEGAAPASEPSSGGARGAQAPPSGNAGGGAPRQAAPQADVFQPPPPAPTVSPASAEHNVLLFLGYGGGLLLVRTLLLKESTFDIDEPSEFLSGARVAAELKELLIYVKSECLYLLRELVINNMQLAGTCAWNPELMRLLFELIENPVTFDSSELLLEELMSSREGLFSTRHGCPHWFRQPPSRRSESPQNPDEAADSQAGAGGEFHHQAASGVRPPHADSAGVISIPPLRQTNLIQRLSMRHVAVMTRLLSLLLFERDDRHACEDTLALLQLPRRIRHVPRARGASGRGQRHHLLDQQAAEKNAHNEGGNVGRGVTVTEDTSREEKETQEDTRGDAGPHGASDSCLCNADEERRREKSCYDAQTSDNTKERRAFSPDSSSSFSLSPPRRPEGTLRNAEDEDSTATEGDEGRRGRMRYPYVFPSQLESVYPARDKVGRLLRRALDRRLRTRARLTSRSPSSTVSGASEDGRDASSSSSEATSSRRRSLHSLSSASSASLEDCRVGQGEGAGRQLRHGAEEAGGPRKATGSDAEAADRAEGEPTVTCPRAERRESRSAGEEARAESRRRRHSSAPRVSTSSRQACPPSAMLFDAWRGRWRPRYDVDDGSRDAGHSDSGGEDSVSHSDRAWICQRFNRPSSLALDRQLYVDVHTQSTRELLRELDLDGGGREARNLRCCPMSATKFFHSSSCDVCLVGNQRAILDSPDLLERLVDLLKLQVLPMPVCLSGLTCGNMPGFESANSLIQRLSQSTAPLFEEALGLSSSSGASPSAPAPAAEASSAWSVAAGPAASGVQPSAAPGGATIWPHYPEGGAYPSGPRQSFSLFQVSLQAAGMSARGEQPVNASHPSAPSAAASGASSVWRRLSSFVTGSRAGTSAAGEEAAPSASAPAASAPAAAAGGGLPPPPHAARSAGAPRVAPPGHFEVTFEDRRDGGEGDLLNFSSQPAGAAQLGQQLSATITLEFTPEGLLVLPANDNALVSSLSAVPSFEFQPAGRDVDQRAAGGGEPRRPAGASPVAGGFRDAPQGGPSTGAEPERRASSACSAGQGDLSPDAVVSTLRPATIAADRTAAEEGLASIPPFVPVQEGEARQTRVVPAPVTLPRITFPAAVVTAARLRKVQQDREAAARQQRERRAGSSASSSSSIATLSAAAASGAAPGEVELAETLASIGGFVWLPRDLAQGGSQEGVVPITEEGYAIIYVPDSFSGQGSSSRFSPYILIPPPTSGAPDTLAFSPPLAQQRQMGGRQTRDGTGGSGYASSASGHSLASYPSAVSSLGCQMSSTSPSPQVPSPQLQPSAAAASPFPQASPAAPAASPTRSGSSAADYLWNLFSFGAHSSSSSASSSFESESRDERSSANVSPNSLFPASSAAPPPTPAQQPPPPPPPPSHTIVPSSLPSSPRGSLRSASAASSSLVAAALRGRGAATPAPRTVVQVMVQAALTAVPEGDDVFTFASSSQTGSLERSGGSLAPLLASALPHSPAPTNLRGAADVGGGGGEAAAESVLAALARLSGVGGGSAATASGQFYSSISQGEAHTAVPAQGGREPAGSDASLSRSSGGWSRSGSHSSMSSSDSADAASAQSLAQQIYQSFLRPVSASSATPSPPPQPTHSSGGVRAHAAAASGSSAPPAGPGEHPASAAPSAPAAGLNNWRLVPGVGWMATTIAGDGGGESGSNAGASAGGISTSELFTLLGTGGSTGLSLEQQYAATGFGGASGTWTQDDVGEDFASFSFSGAGGEPMGAAGRTGAQGNAQDLQQLQRIFEQSYQTYRTQRRNVKKQEQAEREERRQARRRRRAETRRRASPHYKDLFPDGNSADLPHAAGSASTGLAHAFSSSFSSSESASSSSRRPPRRSWFADMHLSHDQERSSASSDAFGLASSASASSASPSASRRDARDDSVSQRATPGSAGRLSAAGADFTAAPFRRSARRASRGKRAGSEGGAHSEQEGNVFARLLRRLSSSFFSSSRPRAGSGAGGDAEGRGEAPVTAEEQPCRRSSFFSPRSFEGEGFFQRCSPGTAPGGVRDGAGERRRRDGGEDGLEAQGGATDQDREAGDARHRRREDARSWGVEDFPADDRFVSPPPQDERRAQLSVQDPNVSPLTSSSPGLLCSPSLPCSLSSLSHPLTSLSSASVTPHVASTGSSASPCEHDFASLSEAVPRASSSAASLRAPVAPPSRFADVVAARSDAARARRGEPRGPDAGRCGLRVPQVHKRREGSQRAKKEGHEGATPTATGAAGLTERERARLRRYVLRLERRALAEWRRAEAAPEAQEEERRVGGGARARREKRARRLGSGGSNDRASSSSSSFSLSSSACPDDGGEPKVRQTDAGGVTEETREEAGASPSSPHRPRPSSSSRASQGPRRRVAPLCAAARGSSDGDSSPSSDESRAARLFVSRAASLSSFWSSSSDSSVMSSSTEDEDEEAIKLRRLERKALPADFEAIASLALRRRFFQAGGTEGAEKEKARERGGASPLSVASPSRALNRAAPSWRPFGGDSAAAERERAGTAADDSGAATEAVRAAHSGDERSNGLETAEKREGQVRGDTLGGAGAMAKEEGAERDRKEVDERDCMRGGGHTGGAASEEPWRNYNSELLYHVQQGLSQSEKREDAFPEPQRSGDEDEEEAEAQTGSQRASLAFDASCSAPEQAFSPRASAACPSGEQAFALECASSAHPADYSTAAAGPGASSVPPSSALPASSSSSSFPGVLSFFSSPFTPSSLHLPQGAGALPRSENVESQGQQFPASVLRSPSQPSLPRGPGSSQAPQETPQAADAAPSSQPAAAAVNPAGRPAASSGSASGAHAAGLGAGVSGLSAPSGSAPLVFSVPPEAVSANVLGVLPAGGDGSLNVMSGFSGAGSGGMTVDFMLATALSALSQAAARSNNEALQMLLNSLIQHFGSPTRSYVLRIAGLSQHQPELYFVICGLLAGRFRREVQQRLNQCGIVPLLSQLFDAVVWFSPPDEPSRKPTVGEPDKARMRSRERAGCGEEPGAEGADSEAEAGDAEPIADEEEEGDADPLKVACESSLCGLIVEFLRVIHDVCDFESGVVAGTIKRQLLTAHERNVVMHSLRRVRRVDGGRGTRPPCCVRVIRRKVLVVHPHPMMNSPPAAQARDDDQGLPPQLVSGREEEEEDGGDVSPTRDGAARPAGDAAGLLPSPPSTWATSPHDQASQLSPVSASSAVSVSSSPPLSPSAFCASGAPSESGYGAGAGGPGGVHQSSERFPRILTSYVFKGTSGLLTKLITVYASEPCASVYKFWLASSIEACIRGGDPLLKIFAAERGLIRLLLRDIVEIAFQQHREQARQTRLLLDKYAEKKSQKRARGGVESDPQTAGLEPGAHTLATACLGAQATSNTPPRPLAPPAPLEPEAPAAASAASPCQAASVHRGILQSCCDLLGELIKFNPYVLHMLNRHLAKDPRTLALFLNVIVGNLVDSNVLLRSVYLTIEFCRQVRHLNRLILAAGRRALTDPDAASTLTGAASRKAEREFGGATEAARAALASRLLRVMKVSPRRQRESEARDAGSRGLRLSASDDVERAACPLSHPLPSLDQRSIQLQALEAALNGTLPEPSPGSPSSAPPLAFPPRPSILQSRLPQRVPPFPSPYSRGPSLAAAAAALAAAVEDGEAWEPDNRAGGLPQHGLRDAVSCLTSAGEGPPLSPAAFREARTAPASWQPSAVTDGVAPASCASGLAPEEVEKALELLRHELVPLWRAVHVFERNSSNPYALHASDSPAVKQRGMSSPRVRRGAKNSVAAAALALAGRGPAAAKDSGVAWPWSPQDQKGCGGGHAERERKEATPLASCDRFGMPHQFSDCCIRGWHAAPSGLSVPFVEGPSLRSLLARAAARKTAGGEVRVGSSKEPENDAKADGAGGSGDGQTGGAAAPAEGREAGVAAGEATPVRRASDSVAVSSSRARASPASGSATACPRLLESSSPFASSPRLAEAAAKGLYWENAPVWDDVWDLRVEPSAAMAEDAVKKCRELHAVFRKKYAVEIEDVVPEAGSEAEARRPLFLFARLQRTALIKKLMCVVPFDTVAPDTICCVNSCLLLLMLALLDGELEETLDAVRCDLAAEEAGECPVLSRQAPGTPAVDAASSSPPESPFSSSARLLFSICRDAGNLPSLVSASRSRCRRCQALALARAKADSQAGDARAEKPCSRGEEGKSEIRAKSQDLPSSGACKPEGLGRRRGDGETETAGQPHGARRDAAEAEDADNDFATSGDLLHCAARLLRQHNEGIGGLSHDKKDLRGMSLPVYNFWCLLHFWQLHYSRRSTDARGLEFSCQIPLAHWHELVTILGGRNSKRSSLAFTEKDKVCQARGRRTEENLANGETKDGGTATKPKDSRG
ncbi:hypothetical protein BESB_048150 [Besnoitia besnoiti]|uniref:Uncharacterized protein n=1 Tax=Besnoitia besnoiti TaxID=94643 RepID=A0A2A9MLN3_BESBE|nr:hypothetical protein BESB_048150 [Besnoitia besnoiti]PFH36623.1 hypothetical protein BESB_048150 [Besnoitia besnoiti]